LFRYSDFHAGVDCVRVVADDFFIVLYVAKPGDVLVVVDHWPQLAVAEFLGGDFFQRVNLAGYHHFVRDVLFNKGGVLYGARALLEAIRVVVVVEDDRARAVDGYLGRRRFGRVGRFGVDCNRTGGAGCQVRRVLHFVGYRVDARCLDVDITRDYHRGGQVYALAIHGGEAHFHVRLVIIQCQVDKTREIDGMLYVKICIGICYIL